MSPEQRRTAIISATLPLLAEHGTKVTTSQIAAAAGIAEGTVFRVFSDKQELIRACIDEVMRPEAGLAQIRAVPRDLGLPQRLSLMAHAMSDRMTEIGAVMHALAASGYQLDRLHQDGRRVDRDQWLADTVRAVVDMIGSDAAGLRIPPERTAHLLLGLVFSSQFATRLRQGHSTRADPGDIDELVDIFLHGVLKG